MTDRARGAQFAVIAKAPVPGAVKTRLCPPYTPRQAADLAAAALADTLSAVGATPAARRVLLLDRHGSPAPAGWDLAIQRGDGLAARLANGYRDLARPGLVTLILAGDTPQVSPDLLTAAGQRLAAGPADAVFGPTEDGGFWLLGLRDPGHGEALRRIAMSTPTTGERTLAALRRRGLRVGLLPRLRDVDTAEDVASVAAAHPGTRFAATARRHARQGASTHP